MHEVRSTHPICLTWPFRQPGRPGRPDNSKMGDLAIIHNFRQEISMRKNGCFVSVHFRTHLLTFDKTLNNESQVLWSERFAAGLRQGI
jgi:hypothetical protein